MDTFEEVVSDYTKGKTWLWLVMPPAAVLSATIAKVTVIYVFAISVLITNAQGGSYFHNDITNSIIAPIVSFAVCGYVLAYVAHLLAPGKKTAASTAVVVMFGGLSVVFGMLVAIDGIEPHAFVDVAVYFTGVITMAISASIYIFSKSN